MYSDFIKQSLAEASEIAKENFGKVSGIDKAGDNNQVLTQTDLDIGNLLVAKVKEAYPDHNIIDEEAGVIDNKSELTWVIDPIDGTSNFANGLPMYGVMIGLLQNGTPIAGGVTLPYFDEIYLAEKGSGATCNGKQIYVADGNNLSKSLVAYGIDGHQEEPSITHDESKTLGDIVLAIRNLRSSNSVFDMMMVARGRYGGYLNRTSKIWDNVASQIILEEAGAAVTDYFGKPIDYSKPLSKADANFTACFAPPELHKQLQSIIQNTQ